MFCSKCGSQIPENENYCPNCGVAILRTDDIPVMKSNTEYVSESVPETEVRKKGSIFSSAAFKMLIVFIMGSMISYIASCFIPIDEIALIVCGFIFLAFITFLIIVFKLINSHFRFATNIIITIASFALAVYFRLFNGMIDDVYITYGVYFLLACGFISLFVLLCRIIFSFFDKNKK